MITTRSIALPFALYTLFNFTTMLLEVPMVRLFEHAACARTLKRPQTNEAECKTAGIQNTLTSIVGWKLTLDACAGFTTAMFYGSLAERRGEKLVLLLAISGWAAMVVVDIIVCSFPFIFPVQAVWISSFFLLIGGGQRIFNSMIFTLVSDALDGTKRTTFLYWLAFGPHCMRFIAPRIAAGLMKAGLLAPFWLGLSILALMFSIVPIVINSDRPKEISNDEYLPILGPSEPGNGAAGQTSSRTSPIRNISYQSISRQNNIISSSELIQTDSIYHQARHFIRKNLHDTNKLLNSPKTLFCLCTVFLKKIGYSSSAFAFQYVSERFGWELQETTWLRVVSGAGAISIGVLAPLITAQLVGRGFYPPFVDLLSIRSALAILSTAFFATWKATSSAMVMLSMFGIGFGEGLEPALQGFITFAADSIGGSRVFTTYAFFDAAAELTAGPLIARLLAIGRTESHPSDGVCFLTSSIIFASLLIWACFIKVHRPQV